MFSWPHPSQAHLHQVLRQIGRLPREAGALAVAAKLNLKAKIESSESYFAFKRSNHVRFQHEF
jgi:hypothetical protein